LGNTFNTMSTQISTLLQNQNEKISELDLLRSALEKSQENLRTFFLSVNDFIFVINQKEEIIYANHLVENQLGYSPEEIIGANIYSIFLRNFINSNPTQLFSETHSFDTADGYLLCQDGSSIEIEMKLSKGLWNDQRVTFGIARNISERIYAEKEIKKQIQRLESLHRIDQTITGTLDLNITMNVLLSQLNQQLNIQGSTVLLYDAITHQLDFFTEQGFNFTGLFKHAIRIGDGFAGKAAINRQVLINEDVNFPLGETSLPPFLNGRHFQTVYDIPLIAKGELKGVLELYSNTPAMEDISWKSFLGTLATQAALAIDNTTLFNDLQKTNTELFLAYDITLEGWVKTLELRDLESKQHSERIMDMTMMLIKQFNFRDSALPHIRRGALLHDIGKLGIPDQILNKQGPLTEKEWQIVKQHPTIAYDLLSRIPFLKPALNIPYSHHERWDGTGYPQGLANDHIPLEARIFAVIDVWDALPHDCVYRKAWKKADALTFIEENAGTQFDPNVVKTFLSFITQNPD
jgi:PAS domain S-box-containing protein